MIASNSAETKVKNGLLPSIFLFYCITYVNEKVICSNKWLDAANQNNDSGINVTVIRFPYLLDWWARTTTTAPVTDEGRVTITEERERHRVRTESVEGGGTFFG